MDIINDNNEDWILVEKKKKKNNNIKKTNYKQNNNRQNNNKQNNNGQNNNTEKNDYLDYVSKKYSMVLRPINEKDYTLTEDEMNLVKGQISLSCVCCWSTFIGDIIKRPFTSCGVCYCCEGDNPEFDSSDLCMFVDESLEHKIIFWDNDCPYKYYKDR